MKICLINAMFQNSCRIHQAQWSYFRNVVWNYSSKVWLDLAISSCRKEEKKKKQTTGTPIPRTEKRPCHLDGIPQVLRLNHQINRELQTVHWYQRKLFLAAVSPTAVCPWRCVAKTQVSTQCRPTSLGIQVKPEPCQENNSYSHLRDTSVCRNGNGRSAFYSIKKSTRGGWWEFGGGQWQPPSLSFVCHLPRIKGILSNQGTMEDFIWTKHTP